MNCITYARVSTERQAERELSLPAQEQGMREYAQRQGWTIVEEFVESGASGRTAVSRPALTDLLARCRKSPQIDVVLVHKIDRLARNVFDHATIRTVLRQKNIRLASVVESIDDTVSGQLVENIMASIAEFYSANLGEETKKGMRMLAEKGGWPHRPPKGYLPRRDSRGKPYLEIDLNVAPLLRRAFELYATGAYSFKSLSAYLFKEGLMTERGQRLGPGLVQKILRNRFYLGEVNWKGVPHRGTHQPLIDAGTFSKAQEVMQKRKRGHPPRVVRRYFWLRNVARCAECGGRMTAERHGRFGYYRCVKTTIDKHQCQAKYANCTRAHTSVERWYRGFALTEQLKEQMTDAVISRLRPREGTTKARLRSLKLRQTGLQSREIQLTQRLADGELPIDAYRVLIEKTKHELETVERRLEAAQGGSATGARSVQRVINRSSNLWDLHCAMTQMRQQQLLSLVFERIVFRNGNIESVVATPPFDTRPAPFDDYSKALLGEVLSPLTSN